MTQFAGSAVSVGPEGSELAPGADLDALQAIHDVFARQLRAGVSAVLSTDISATVTGIRQDTYAGFQKQLPSPTYLCPIALMPEKRASALYLSPELIFPVLEAMMGGAITPSADLTRRLTAIEEDVLDPLVQVVLRALSRAWQSAGDMEFRRSFDLPFPHEEILVVTVELEISEDTKGSLSVALPSVLIRRLKARADRQTRPVETNPTDQESDSMLKLIQSATLEFEARLEGPKVGLRDLLNLTEGQIVLLDHGIDAGVDGLLNKSRYFKGQVVSDGKKRLLLIDDFRESETT